ncbi:MAG: AmmeMemoRadiSam system radical SAM enzyme [Candidatus Cloacimonetes bacterium]|nr:AmmeMemoRadiSam system radical SAM enzyme [Candidatus Cloacimonadota bacterium]
MREAMHNKACNPLGNAPGYIMCLLCPHLCKLNNGETGICRGRKAIDNKLYAVNYAETVCISLDPIEKKPLYHYNPGSYILSLGPNSCNLSCSFCQNWQISQVASPTSYISIEELAKQVRSGDNPQVAFTYSEPLMWYEYIMDFADYAPDIAIVLVTNGFINELPWKQIIPKVKAVNIDLKASTEDFYLKQCNGMLQTVKQNIQLAVEAGIHVEITYLLIPGLNNQPEEIEELASFVAKLDQNIPLHISAYRPMYKMQIRATTTEEVKMACDIAAKHLKYVYAGNCYLPQYSVSRLR